MEKINPDLSVEDVLKELIADVGYSEVMTILQMIDSKYTVDCCNPECSWTGYSTDCSKTPDDLLCPICHTVVQPVHY